MLSRGLKRAQHVLGTATHVATTAFRDRRRSARRVLRQIPPAALAALVVPAFLRPDGELGVWQPELAAGALAAVVCWRTRSTIATLAVGMGAVYLLRQL